MDENSNIIVNEYISGVHGFSPKYFSDKFFITTTPEGPRLLLDFNILLNSNPTIVSENRSEPVPEITEETKPSEESTIEQYEFSDISDIEVEDVNGKLIKPFSNFNTHILPGLLDGAELFDRKEEAVEHINNSIEDMLQVIKTGQNAIGVPKTNYEAIRDFLMSLVEFGEDNTGIYNDLPSSIDIIKAFYGSIVKLPKEVKEKIRNSNFRISLDKLINDINQCK
jgi:hypothetical protein